MLITIGDQQLEIRRLKYQLQQAQEQIKELHKQLKEKSEA
jgi:hypothetical protein